PRLLLRNFLEIVCGALRIFRPVFFFLFDDLREQFTPGAWRDLRERNRSLVVNVAGGTSPMVRPVVCDHAPACLERLACRRGRRWREPGLGTPRGAMRPVPVPVLLPCPCRGLKDQRGPWAPSCDRHGMDHPPPWPLASGGGDPRPLFCKIPGTRPCMVLLHAGRSAGHCRPLQAAIGGAGGSLLAQGASSCEANRVAFFQGRTALPGARRKAPSRQRAPQWLGRARGPMG